MGSFERFKTKTHFNSLKRLVGVTALAALAVKLLTIALATAAGGGTPLDLLARVPASVADLGAALLVFEVLRSRRPLQLAARSAILVAVSPVLFVASGLHGDRIGVAVALLLLAIYLLVGLTYAYLYPVIAFITGEPFFVQTSNPNDIDFLYFSYVTLTTVGYGDFTAATPAGRMIAVSEALTGQLYLVSAVALLVGNIGRTIVRGTPKTGVEIEPLSEAEAQEEETRSVG